MWLLIMSDLISFAADICDTEMLLSNFSENIGVGEIFNAYLK